MRRLSAAALLVAAAPAWSCGTCAEDRMAATYDHAVVQKAAASGRVMVFCALDGAAWDAARVRSAARRVGGVDAGSVRVAREPAGVSFALDAKRQSPEGAVLALQAAAPAGARVSLVRVLGAPAP
jgi:hypothetical protein